MGQFIAVGASGVSKTQASMISNRLAVMVQRKTPNAPRIDLGEMGIFLSNLRLDFKIYLESELDDACRQFSTVLNGDDKMYTSGVLPAALKALYPPGELTDDTIVLYEPKAQLLFLMSVDLVLELLHKDVDSTQSSQAL